MFQLFECDTRVIKYYMNELRLYLNENDPEDKIVKKNLKQLKVTTYINKVHFSLSMARS